MAILTVTPEPEADESLLGYLLRLAKCNGLQNVRELISLCRISNIPTLPRPTLVSYGRLINGISDATGISVEKFCAAFNQDATAALYDNRRYIRHLDTQLFQCCPLCMAENAYHRALWQSQLSTICYKHGVQLIDACPGCGASFGWNYQQFAGCSNCGQKFEEYETEPVSLLPFEVALKASDESSVDLVGRLCAAICHALNHEDLMFTPISDFQMIVSPRREVINYAYQLLACRQLRELHCNDKARKNVSHDGIHLFDWLTGLAVEENGLLANLPRVERKISYVSTHRAEIARQRHIPLERHIGVQEAAFILNLPMKYMWTIVGGVSGCLTPLKSGKLNENIILDHHAILKFQQKIAAAASQLNCLIDDPVSLNWVIERLLPLFYADLNDLLTAIFNDRLPIFRDTTCDSWQDVRLQRKQVVRYLEANFGSADEQNMSLSELANLLCVEETVASAFVRWTPVKYARWTKNPTISLTLVIEFLKRHVVLNRYCSIYEISICQVLPLLKSLPVEFQELHALGCIILSKNAATDALLQELRTI